MSLRTKVTLMTKTEYPIETVYSQWFQSRKETKERVPLPAELHKSILKERADLSTNDPGPGPIEKEVREVFEQVIAMKMPLGETIDFVFLIENLPVALREQLVRHRIGHKFGDQLGADVLISEVANNSTFWSQTTRIVDMKNFAKNGEYLTPHWLEEHGETPMPGFRKGGSSHDELSDLKNAYAQFRGTGAFEKAYPELSQILEQGLWRPIDTVADFYHTQMMWIQAAYRRLTAVGMPLEDARNILPVAMMHRFSWKTNLSSLMHVMSRRGCWLAQLGFWKPVIHDIVEELSTKVHPMFRRMIDPPCINSKGEYEACAFGRENDEIAGKNGEYKGEYPTCSLWTNHEGKLHGNETEVVGSHRLPRYEKMQQEYTKLWGRDPKSGKRIVVS